MEKSDTTTKATPEERFNEKFDRMLAHLKGIEVHKRCVIRSPVPYSGEIADRLREMGTELPRIKGGMAQLPQPQEVGVIETYLENYSNIFKATARNVEKHKQHMKYYNDQVYKPNKQNFLRGPAETEWLSGGRVDLKYSPESKNANNRKVCIKLSMIYSDALASAKFKEEDLNRRNASDEEWSKATELNFPEGMLLYLFRLALECETLPEDRKTLEGHIKVLEKELKIGQDATPSNDNTALGRFIGRMTKGRKDLPNIDIPEGSNALVDGIVGTIDSNPKLENIIKDVLGGVDFSGKPESLFSTLAINLMDPTLVNRVQDAAKDFDPNSLPPSLKNAVPMPAPPPMAAPPDPFAPKGSASAAPASAPVPAPASPPNGSQ